MCKNPADFFLKRSVGHTPQKITKPYLNLYIFFYFNVTLIIRIYNFFILCILQELTEQMRAFVAEYEKNADGKIDIIEVNKDQC